MVTGSGGTRQPLYIPVGLSADWPIPAKPQHVVGVCYRQEDQSEREQQRAEESKGGDGEGR
ncbi:hypothetical protein INR49_031957 [Caranx melampygus]|nr:hypothetical protein INR49_031957 [Caranx melampygus]